MKKLILLLTLVSLVLCEPVWAQSNGVKAKNTLEYVKEHYTKRQVRIPMRDGITLFTAIYEPKDNTEKHPILMTRPCYSVGSDETNLRSMTSSSVAN